jgi:hypothetical protein
MGKCPLPGQVGVCQRLYRPPAPSRDPNYVSHAQKGLVITASGAPPFDLDKFGRGEMPEAVIGGKGREEEHSLRGR